MITPEYKKCKVDQILLLIKEMDSCKPSLPTLVGGNLDVRSLCNMLGVAYLNSLESDRCGMENNLPPE